jgi:glycosyltransferase involved in cell wall biosynthesis
MKRLLWITEHYPPTIGGMANACDRIVYHLRDFFHIDVLHLCRATQSKPPYRPAHVMEEAGGNCYVFHAHRDIAHTLNCVYLWLSKQHQKQPYEALVAFGGYAPVFAVPTFAALLGLPYVLLLRGNDFDAGLFQPKRRDLLLTAIEQAAAVCCVSSDKVQKIRALLPHKPAVYYTPNGIDTAEWKAYEHDYRLAADWRKMHSEGRTVVGLFGQLKEKKGLDFFVDSLQQSAYSDEVHLLLIGDLEEEMRRRLTGAGQLHYTHIPFVERMQLIPYYLACDWMAIPSFYDGMPNVLLEAAALQRPAIGSQVAGIADFIEHGRNGFLFEAANRHSLLEVLQTALELPANEREAMGKAAFEGLQAAFTARHEAGRYAGIFEEVLFRKNAAQGA